MKNSICWVFIAIVLAACSIPAPAAQPTPAQATDIPSPTSTIELITPTSIRNPLDTLTPDELTALDLGSILVQPGDLPDGYSAEQASDVIPGYVDLQGASCKYRLYQGFTQNEKSAGGVTLLICTNPTVGQAMFSIGYDMAGWGEVQFDLPDIGNNMILGTLNKSLGADVDGMNVLFSHRAAVVYIRMTGTVDQDAILAYAQNLDERLGALIDP